MKVLSMSEQGYKADKQNSILDAIKVFLSSSPDAEEQILYVIDDPTK
jgi:hypothetical protein